MNDPVPPPASATVEKPDPTTPWGLLIAAVNAVPVVRYALGLVGVAAAMSIIRTLPKIGEVPLAAMGPLLIGMIVVMGALALLALIFAPRQETRDRPAQVFLWAICLFVIALMIAYLSALIFGVPRQLALTILPRQAADSPLIPIGPAEGFVYYGMQNSGQQGTDAGKIFPLAGRPFPHFGDIRVGTVFVTSEQVHMREGPSATYADVKLLDARECVKVIEIGPMNNDGPTASGGWLKAREAPCKN